MKREERKVKSKEWQRRVFFRTLNRVWPHANVDETDWKSGGVGKLFRAAWAAGKRTARRKALDDAK